MPKKIPDTRKIQARIWTNRLPTMAIVFAPMKMCFRLSRRIAGMLPPPQRDATFRIHETRRLCYAIVIALLSG